MAKKGSGIMEVIIKDNYEEVSQLAAEYLVNTVKTKSNAVLGLPTGSTPVGMYRKVVEIYKDNSISFENITTFNLDEYVGLDATNENSYSYYMNNNLFSHVDIKKENTHIPNGVARNLEEECNSYENLIKTKGPIDIMFLGIGPNGHIGFNEPEDYFEPLTHIVKLTEDTITANSRFFDDMESVPKSAITMGMKAILSAKKIVLLATGEAKADAVFKSIKGKVTPQVPASVLQLHNDVTFILDKDAAKYL